MADDTKDWAEREAENRLRKQEAEEEASEKRDRNNRLKGERGNGLFEQLHAWMEEQAKVFYEKTQERVIEVGEIEPWGGPDYLQFFQVSDPTGARRPMKISYRPAPQWNLTAECGVVPNPQYSLSVGDNGILFFETLKGRAKTIPELGSELLDTWKSLRY